MRLGRLMCGRPVAFRQNDLISNRRGYASPVIRGVASQKYLLRLPGRAEPFRTSGGQAASPYES